MREQVYSDPRPKEHFDRFHERARTREPDWVYELTRLLTSLYAYTFLRARAIAVENVPGSGAVILAPNHFSFMDHFLMGCFIRRKVRFMAKSQLFKGPMQAVYTHGGVFPVRRGARDEETFITAELILSKGGAVTMYPEGGRSRTGKVAEHAKPGIGRLALESGAQLEAAPVPQGDDPVRRADALGGDPGLDPRAAAGGRRPDPGRDPRHVRGSGAARPAWDPEAAARAAPCPPARSQGRRHRLSGSTAAATSSRAPRLRAAEALSLEGEHAGST